MYCMYSWSSTVFGHFAFFTLGDFWYKFPETTFGLLSVTTLTRQPAKKHKTRQNDPVIKWWIVCRRGWSSISGVFCTLTLVRFVCIKSDLVPVQKNTVFKIYHWWEGTRNCLQGGRVYTGSRGGWCNSLDESADDESRQPGCECRHLVEISYGWDTLWLTQRGGAPWANPVGVSLLLRRANWCVISTLGGKKTHNVPVLKEMTTVNRRMLFVCHPETLSPSGLISALRCAPGVHLDVLCKPVALSNQNAANSCFMTVGVVMQCWIVWLTNADQVLAETSRKFIKTVQKKKELICTLHVTRSPQSWGGAHHL